MPTNEILPFAQTGGPRVLSQAEYAALSSVFEGGLPAGILPGAHLNKILRQINLVSIALAQLVVDVTGESVVDGDGAVAFQAQLLAAFQTISLAGATGTLPVRSVATTTYTLAVTDIGTKLRFTHVDGCDVTIPAADAGFGVGFTTELYCASASGVLTLTSGDTLNLPAGANPEAWGTGSPISLHKVAATEWDVVGDLFIP